MIEIKNKLREYNELVSQLKLIRNILDNKIIDHNFEVKLEDMTCNVTLSGSELREILYLLIKIREGECKIKLEEINDILIKVMRA